MKKISRKPTGFVNSLPSKRSYSGSLSISNIRNARTSSRCPRQRPRCPASPRVQSAATVILRLLSEIGLMRSPIATETDLQMPLNWELL